VMLEQIYLLLLRLLAPHACFYVREMRILGHTGLLQSYSSLVLDSLAHAFVPPLTLSTSASLAVSSLPFFLS
jgi:hypothetical protein